MSDISDKSFWVNKIKLICLFFILVVIVGLFWLGTKPNWISLFPVNPPLDKFVHFFVFGFITVLLWFSASKPHTLTVVIIAIIISLADELHQSFIPKRTASIDDFLADLIGILFFIFILKYIQRKRQVNTVLSILIKKE